MIVSLIVILAPEPLFPTSAVVIPITSPTDQPFPVSIPNVLRIIPSKVPSALNVTVSAIKFLPLPVIGYKFTFVYVPAEYAAPTFAVVIPVKETPPPTFSI